MPSAFPATPPALDERLSCATGTCVVSLALSSSVTSPATAPAPAHLWEHHLEKGAALSFPKDDALAVLVVVLEGSLSEERGKDEPKTLLVDDDGKPLPEQPLTQLSGVFYRGGGFTLRADRGSSARVLVASVLRRDATAFKAKGAAWTKRPTGYLDSIDRFDLRGAPIVFGGGKMNATIGIEDREEAAPVFEVKEPDPKGRGPAPPPPTEGRSTVTWKPDASCSLLGIAPGGAVPEHVHANEWELLAIVSGEGEMTLGANATKAVKAGSLVTIPKGLPHAFRSRGTAPVVAIQMYTPPGPEQRFKTAK